MWNSLLAGTRAAAGPSKEQQLEEANKGLEEKLQSLQLKCEANKGLEEKLQSLQLKCESLAAELVAPALDSGSLQQFINLATFPMVALDMFGRVTDFNEQAVSVMKISKESILGQEFAAVFKKTVPDQQRFRGRVADALAGKQLTDFEVVTSDSTGARVDMLISLPLRRASDQSVTGVFVVGQVITETKKAEVIATELRSFIDGANSLILALDENLVVTEWNELASELTGMSKSFLKGKKFVDAVISEEHKISLQGVLEETLRGSGTTNFEFPVIHVESGRRIEFMMNTTPRRLTSGKVVGVWGIAQDITATRLLLKERELVAKQWEVFIQTANAPIIGIDCDGFVQKWNDKAVEITGFSRTEVLGKHLVNTYVTKMSRDLVKDAIENALQGFSSGNLELPLYTKDKGSVDVLLNCTPNRNSHGTVIGVIAIGQDITERKRAELEKSRIAQELQTFIDTANAPIFGIGVDGLCNEWNNKAASMTGYSREEVMGIDLSSAIHPMIVEEFRDSLKEVLDNALQGREASNFEFPIYQKGGTRMELLLNATTKRDVDGKIVGVVGVGQDVTERKKAEQEKTRVAEELQTFIDTANAPIFGIDDKGRVNEWNNKAAEITGFSSSEVVGRDLVTDFITEEYRVSVREVFNNALMGAEAANFEFPLYTKDKRRVDVLLNATTRRDVRGRVVGVIGVGQDITERKQVEIEKMQVAQELQTFIDTANAPIFGIDAKGQVNEWNNMAAAITGFTRSEVFGRDLVQDFITEEYRVSVKEVLDNALKGSEAANFEFPLYTKDSKRVDVLLNATTRRDVRGHVVGVIGVGQDITERKLVEIEKTRVAMELQTFIDTANAPIFGIDARGKVNEWNNKAAEITGFSGDEVIGRDLVTEFIDEVCRHSVQEVLNNALKGKEAANFEFPLYTKDKRRVDVLLNATTRRDVTGHVVGVIGVGQDITERKQAEQEKTRVAQELQTFIDTANAPIFGIDARGRVNEWNNKAAEITGFTSSEVVGRDLVEDFITEEYRTSVKEVLDNALQGQEAANFEFPLYTKDKRRVDVLLNATTRRDITGKVLGVLGVGQDITERKWAEEEMARVAKELQTFIDTANAPIFGIDAYGNVNEWNNKAAAITGFARDEVMGQSLVEVYITEEFRASVKEVLDNALKGQEAANFEFPLFTKDKRRVDVLLNATTRRDLSGVVVGVIGVGQDITERKLIEIEKTRVAQELQTFIDTANAPIFGIDAKGLVNEWNNKAAAITGFSSQEVLGRDLVQEFITEEYRTSVKEVLDNALRGYEAANFEFPLYTKDQRRVDVLLNATTRRDTSGHVVGMIGVGQDITERNLAEEEKTRVAKELQTFIDTANAPIFGIDARGRVNEWNNKAAEITGFTSSEVVGRDLVEDFITEEYRTSVKEVLDNALQGQEAANFEFPLYTKDKRRVDVLLNATTRRDITGKVVGVLGVGQDITERKWAEEEMARVAKELQTFIDTANAPIFGIDAKGMVNEWNNKAAAITGFSRNEVMGQNLVEVYITDEFRASVREVLDNALMGQEEANFEFPLFTKKEKKRVDVLLNATTRRDVSGNVVGMIGVGQDITERKRVEVEKTRVAQELQTFIDTANAPIFGIDAKGLVNEWNNKAAEITGFTRDEVMGQNLVEVYITDEFKSPVRDVLDNALRGKEEANFEFPLFTKDQKRVEVLLNATTRRDVKGQIVGVIGVGQDITERKQAELERARVAKELQTFIDTANAPIFGIDEWGQVNEWNNKAAEITGYSRDEVIGQNLVNVYITEEYRASVKEVLDNALKGREAANFEFPLFTKDQRRVDVLLNATTRRDTSGYVVGMIGVGQDITERKYAEEEKTRVAKELQTFIDTANAPIFGIDAQGLVNEWNNKAAEITGFTSAEVVGRDLVQVFITEEFRASVKEVLDDALAGKEAANFEFPLYTKDKRRVDVLLNATTRRDVAGNSVGVIGVGQDITERKQVEIEKTRVAQELQNFIDTANAPIFGIDADGLVNEWNNMAVEITGFTRDEVMGQDLVQVYITEEFRASVKEVLDNALMGREEANFEFPLFTKDQNRVEVLLNATTRRDVIGKVVGMIGVGQDITERKQAELERARVAQELQTFIDTANAPIFGIDANGMVNEWNNMSAQITGFTRDEVMGQSLVNVYITEEYRASVKEVLDNALRGKEEANFEFPLFTKNKKRVDVLLNATTRRDVSGYVVGVIGVGQDITERKSAEEEKTRVAKELQTFIDTANAPIFGIDAQGRVNEWNNKAVEITGFSREDVMGQNLVEVYITEEFRASVKKVMDNALLGQEAANFEFPLFTKDQKRVEVLLNATTRRDVVGKVVGVIGVGQDITERKQAELERTRVAQELQTFIDTANAPIFGIDEWGQVNEWNNKAAHITGFTRDEVMGQNLVEVYITEEFRASVKNVLDNALMGQEAANFEFPLFTKDKRRVDVLLNATTRRDVNKGVVGVIGVGQDITERKQAEQEATRVAKELQTFIDTANAPIFGIDADGKVNEWNNKAVNITGFSRNDVMGQSLVQEFITEEYRVSVQEVLDDALRGIEAANFEFPLYTKDKRRVDVLLNATTRRDVTGHVVGMIGVGQDITERKYAEEEKTRVAKELQTFIDTANAPIFGIDAKGLVNEWNNKAAEITGFTSQEVVGRDLVQEFITEEYRVSVKEVLDDALRGKEAANFEFPLYTKDKRRVDVLLNATTRRDVSGVVVGMIGVGQDITERKYAEEEKTRVAQELQTFIDTANAPIFGIDAYGLVNEWNNKAVEITGFMRNEVMGQDLVQVYITEEFRESVKEVLDNALMGKEAANFEFPLFTKDQKRVEVLLNATTRRDVVGKVVGMIGVGQDITERKQAELEKTRVAQELQNFIDTANAPIFGIDALGLVNEWNNMAVEITGFTRVEVMGQNLVDVYITEEYRASVKEVMDNALRGKEEANFEFPLFTKDQKRVEVLLNATTRRDVIGNPIGVIGVGQDITLRKQVEEERTRVAQELQNFIFTANAPIFGIDAKGLVNEWNNKAVEITGFSRDEVMGQSLVEVYITEEFRASVKKVMDNALLGEETSNFEFPLFTKDQRRVEVLLNATTRRDVSDNVVGVIGVGQDITERKQAEQEKTRVAKELQTFIDTANAPIFGIDAQGRINEWNNKSAEITGFSSQEVVGRDLVQDFITEEYQGSVKEVFDNALKGREAANFEFPLYTKDKRRVDVLLNATTRRDVSGVVVGVIGVGQDITERKQVEIEKTRVAQELQTFIDTANAPIFGIDALGLVNEWNNKAVEITGFSRHEVMGQSLVEVYITDEFRASVKEVLDNALLGDETSNFEFPLFTRDKRRLEVLLNATSRRDVTGKIVGVIGVGQDITEMRRLMNQEAIFNQAQAANEAKSQFLANMSHEMRTPLNVIMGMSQLILDTALSAEAQKFTEQIMTSSESLLFLINEILDLTKIEAGQLELFVAKFDIRQVVEDAVDSVASRALRKGLEICCYFDPRTATCVNGDPDRLRQIMLNLLSNAIKFTKSGQVYVVVEQEEVTSSHATFRFKVYDSGIGISEKGQKKLFNRFSQVDSSTTREFGGTGLGLAISKEFAQLMNGSMGVNSTPNVGSLFWFTAMFQRRSEDHSAYIIELTEPKPPTVMLVANNETLRNSFLRIIEGIGLNVISVVSTEQMAESDQNFDVVILCPSAAYEEGHSLAASILTDGSTTSKYGDDLKTVWTSLHELLKVKPSVKSIILCPLTQLSQATQFRKVRGCNVVSRPTRMSVLRDALLQAIDMSPVNPVPQIAPETVLHQRNTSDLALFPYELVGTRILVAMLDNAQGMVLKAMLTRDTHQCFMCANMSELAANIKQSPTGWNYDVLFLEQGAHNSKESKDYADLDIVRQVRKVEAAAGIHLLKRLFIVGVVSSMDSEECVECLRAGADTCMPKPIRRTNVTEVMEIRSHTLIQPALEGMSVSKQVREPNSRKVRVLVVDDDNGQRTLLKTMLTKEGYEVDTAEDGDLAVKAAQRVTYQVILMDGFMPNKTGWEATKDIRAEEIARGLDASCRCAIIGVTGATSKEDEAKCFQSGMTDVISKPVKRETLVQKVIKWTQSEDKALDATAGSELPSVVAAKAISRAAIILDTDRSSRVVLKGILKALGTTADFASSHAECMSLIQSKEIDMVLMNTTMEGFDYITTLDEIRRVHDVHDADLIPIFGISTTADTTALIRVGFTSVIQKPFDRNIVQEIVLKHMHAEEQGPKSGIMAHGASSAAKDDEKDEKELRVLIVEDHWANRRLLEAMLRKQGGSYLMEAVENGLEAVNITGVRQYDLILMDCNMPIMDGWQATEKIRQTEGPNKMTPIIAVTANAMKGDREKCIASGMDDYISKPVERKRLQEVLGKWVHRTSS